MEEMHLREDILFIILSSVTVTAAIMTIRGALVSPASSAVTPTYSYNFLASVFWLILTFIGSSGLFIVLGMEFLGLIFLIVYVGAICIIFLFVIMMIPGGDQKEKETKGYSFITKTQRVTDTGPFGSPPAIGILIGAILAAELASAVPDSFFNSELEHIGTTKEPLGGAQYSLSSAFFRPGDQVSNLKISDLENSTSGLQNYIYTPEGASGAAALNLAQQNPLLGPNDSFFTLNGSGGTNLEAIGSVLYINYYYAFILVSFILLVAMIGAIVLGRGESP